MGSEIEEVVGMTDKLNHDYIQAEDLGIALVKFKNRSYGNNRRDNRYLSEKSGRNALYIW